MFASVATGATPSSTATVTTIASTSTFTTSKRSGASPAPSNASANGGQTSSASDGVAQGNMLKQLLGIPVSTPPPAPAPVAAKPSSPAPISASSAITVADLFSSISSAPAPSRPTSAVPPGFKPINEDEEATPPGTSHGITPSTPPNKFSRPADDQQTTPTPSSKGKQNGTRRELVAYEFEDEGIVSPWMNEPLQRPRNEHIIPPSPSQLPQPKAVRDKRKGAARRGVSPKPPGPRQAQRQYQGNGYSNLVDQDVVSDVIISALNGPGVPEEILTKERFASDLLGLVQVCCDCYGES